MRKYYIDNIRWATVVTVLLYHVLYMYNAEGILGGLGRITDLPVQHYDAFMYLVYPWIMPVLFLISGVSSRYYLEKHTEKDFVRSRTRKLLVPSTLGLFVFYFIQGYVSLSLSDGFSDLKAAGVPKPGIYLIMLASGSGVMWFMHLLWIYSMILIPVRKTEKGRLLEAGAKTPLWLIPLFFFPVWGAAQILNTPIISVYRFGLYFVFFYLGYYVFSNDEVMDRIRRIAPVMMAAGAVLCIIFTVKYFGENYADKPANRGALYAACAYFGSLAVLGGMARYGDFSNRFTRWMSSKSFGLYLFHYLSISMVALYIAKPGLLPAPACYMLSLAAGFVFGYGLYAIISRIPVYRWLVLGIRKEQKDVQG